MPKNNQKSGGKKAKANNYTTSTKTTSGKGANKSATSTKITSGKGANKSATSTKITSGKGANKSATSTKAINGKGTKANVGPKATQQFKFWSLRTWPLWGKVLGGVILLIIVAIIAVVLRYTTALNGFLNKITDWGKETKSYSVLVKNSSEINELSGLAEKSIGFLSQDPKANNAEQYLQEKVKFEADFYDDTETLTSVLNSEIVSAITLETDRLEMLKEDATESIKDTKVIYTFEIELESEDAERANKEITTEPFVVYISGTDSRAGVKATARSDVNIITVVNPKAGKILLVSIPRDTYVQLHGTTGIKDKLTHAGVYGIDMSKQTIEDFLGINIDYTIKVSFDTVVKLVDQLDGIEINSDKAMRLKAEGKEKYCDYVEGKQLVDGDCALRFARERKSYETGDRHRGQNQQQVITSIIGKLSQSKNYVLKIPAILDIAADSFETDMSRDDIMKFVRMQLGDKINWQVKSIQIDGIGTYEPTYSMGANWPLYVMIPSDESIIEAQNQIKQYLATE